MKKIPEVFKGMSLLMKIASISFLVALALLLLVTLTGYCVDIFANNVFKALFASAYNFFAIPANFIKTTVEILFVAAMIVAVFSGSKKNIAFVLLAKAVLMTLDMTYVTSLLQIMKVFSFGFKNGIVSFGEIWSGFSSFVLMLAYVALAVILLNGFGILNKLMGFVSAGVFSLFLLADAISWTQNFINSIKMFIGRDASGGIYTLLAGCGGSCASALKVCGFIFLSLAAAFAIKGAVIPKKTSSES